MPFLQLIRYKNLILLAFMQLVFRYGFLKTQGVPLALSDWQYSILILSTVLIAAAGYVINNIFDQETDLENKLKKVVVGKSITEEAAYSIYVGLNAAGVAVGFYLSNTIDKPSFAVVFILTASLLYIYSSSLKQIMILGNIVVAALLGLSILIIGIFDLYPIVNMDNQQMVTVFFSVLLDYAVFAFFINLIREIIKDIEDYSGDFKQGLRTLPVVIGIAKTSKIAFALTVLPIVALLWYTNTYFIANNLNFIAGYAFVFVLAPLLIFAIKCWGAKTKNDFHQLSMLLKWILFFGIISVLVLNLNIDYNATR